MKYAEEVREHRACERDVNVSWDSGEDLGNSTSQWRK